MAERVHPSDSPPRSQTSDLFSGQCSSEEFPRKSSPPTGTYVIQVPKDQIYHVPPPGNAHRFQYLSRRKIRRSRCRCFICSFLSVLVILSILAGIAAGVLYLVFLPEAPRYSVEQVSIKGINLTSPSPISPKFDVSVRARNGNGKIGIYYEKGSAVDVYYNDVKLSNGAWPAFYQPAKKVTVFNTALMGSGIQLTRATRREMLSQLKKGTVPFKLRIRAPIKIKIGSVKTWKISVKVNCDITVDKLTAQSKVVSRTCNHDVDLL